MICRERHLASIYLESLVSETTGDKVPFAYAAHCLWFKRTTSYVDLSPHEIELIPGEITSADEGGENGNYAFGKVEYGPNMSSAKIWISGYC